MEYKESPKYEEGLELQNISIHIEPKNNASCINKITQIEEIPSKEKSTKEHEANTLVKKISTQTDSDNGSWMEAQFSKWIIFATY